MGKRNLSQNIKTGKEYRNNDNTNELKKKNKQTKKIHTHFGKSTKWIYSNMVKLGGVYYGRRHQFS